MNIHEYLRTVAGRITSSALADVDNAETWRRELPKRRNTYLAMMGLDGFDPAVPVCPTTLVRLMMRPLPLRSMKRRRTSLVRYQVPRATLATAS